MTGLGPVTHQHPTAVQQSQAPQRAERPQEQSQFQGQWHADSFESARARPMMSLHGDPPVAAVHGAGAVQADPVEPLENPGKIGVVLNAPVDGVDDAGRPVLPTAEELSAQGVGRARLTLSAAYLQSDPAAAGGQPGSELDPGKMQAWETRLREYKNAGIEVTLNLPPEVVHGLPEFKRDGPIRNEPHLLKQSGAVQDVSDAEWAPYQEAYVQRTAELAQRLGPYVDTWEVGNEPDATEKVIIKGQVPPGEEQHYVTDQDGVTHEVNGGFDPGLAPQRYGQLLNAAYDAIKANDNGARDPNDPSQPDPNNRNVVVTAGLVAGDAGESLDGDDSKLSYLEQAARATPDGLRFDAVGLHPYTRNTQDQFNETVDQYAAMAEKVAGRPVPVYITESSPGPGDAADPVYQQEYQQYVKDISTATDRNSNVAGTYYFWGGTFDDHAGLTDMPDAMSTLRQLLGK